MLNILKPPNYTARYTRYSRVWVLRHDIYLSKKNRFIEQITEPSFRAPEVQRTLQEDSTPNPSACPLSPNKTNRTDRSKSAPIDPSSLNLSKGRCQ